MSVGAQRSSGGVLTNPVGFVSGSDLALKRRPRQHTSLFHCIYPGKNLSVYSYGFQEQEDGLIRPQAAASVVGRDAS